MRSITILGCGLAGSWVAHHLALIGPMDFLLFDGDSCEAECRESLNIVKRGITRAQALADHILSISPHSQVEVRGYFDHERDTVAVRGPVLGAMGSAKVCAVTAGELKRAGKSWLTFAIPAKQGLPVIVATTTDDVTEDYFGTPCMSRQQIWAESARAASQLLTM